MELNTINDVINFHSNEPHDLDKRQNSKGGQRLEVVLRYQRLHDVILCLGHLHVLDRAKKKLALHALLWNAAALVLASVHVRLGCWGPRRLAYSWEDMAATLTVHRNDDALDSFLLHVVLPTVRCLCSKCLA